MGKTFSTFGRQVLSAAGLWLIFTGSHPASAQDQPADQPAWYQVEVIIFERLTPSPDGDAEAWPKDISLSYPRNWQKLLSGETAANLLAHFEQDAPGPSQDPLAVPHRSVSEREMGTPEVPLPPLLRQDDHLELAFVKLPRSERGLNESAAAVDRNRNMRVLFHEAWRQPMHSADLAPAIVISSGNRYGEHTELEGAVKLSVSRYLHVYTNLWLTEFVPNYGQEPEHWPPLPPAPEQQRPASPMEMNGQRQMVENREESDVWALDQTQLEDYTSLIEKPFLVTEIVTMNQARRMRSGELHYLDHPRLGLMVRIDRYTPEAASPNTD